MALLVLRCLSKSTRADLVYVSRSLPKNATFVNSPSKLKKIMRGWSIASVFKAHRIVLESIGEIVVRQTVVGGETVFEN